MIHLPTITRKINNSECDLDQQQCDRSPEKKFRVKTLCDLDSSQLNLSVSQEGA